LYHWKLKKWTEIVLESRLKFEQQCLINVYISKYYCVCKSDFSFICCWLVTHNSTKCQQIHCILKFWQLEHKNSDLC
jgi:hypothetical protein